MQNYKKIILVTGGAGFIGANFLNYFCVKYPEYQVINLDKLTYAGNLDNIIEANNCSNYTFVQGDICDENLVKQLFIEHKITDVIHFAAESHVDNSISSPIDFIQTNILGTFNLLNVAKNMWLNSSNSRFHHISTDEVYGSLGNTGLFMETTPYSPNSPYSASKASSDFLARAWHETYNMNITTSNCSNNYGMLQHDEKLIPTVIRNALAGNNIPIYGNGENIRDWLYVLDHCKAIDLIFHQGIQGATYNVGGRNERTNNQVVNTICKILDKLSPKKQGSYKDQINYVTDRLGHDARYAIDATKLETNLKWQAEENFESGIKLTIEWYLKKYHSIVKG